MFIVTIVTKILLRDEFWVRLVANSGLDIFGNIFLISWESELWVICFSF